MRYHEGPQVIVETEVAARPEVLWALVTDLDLPARFSDEFQGADWVDGADGPALGATFLGRNRHRAIGEWEVRCTVTECDPSRCFGWAVGDPDAPAARWRFEIEPRSDGSLLRQWAQMGPGPSGLTPMIEQHPEREEELVEMRLGMWRTNMDATILGIKVIAEEG